MFTRNLPPTSSALMIGNFDGCHLGHQWMAAHLTSTARRLELTPTTLTFSPPPEVFFGRRDDGLSRLQTAEQKSQALRESGIESCIEQAFDQEFSQLSHTEFFARLIVERLAARALVVGSDFCFGYQRKGNVAFLREACRSRDIDFREVSPLVSDDLAVSSTRIRSCLRETGDVRLAAKLLGRPYGIRGCVVRGRQLGRAIGFPTANLGEYTQMLPRNGVYCGYVCLDETTALALPRDAKPAVLNIGVRPTVDQSMRLSVEAHLLDLTQDLYGAKVTFYFVDRLRDERKFANVETLKLQITQDINDARTKF